LRIIQKISEEEYSVGFLRRHLIGMGQGNQY
jgi:hypothetical protein